VSFALCCVLITRSMFVFMFCIFFSFLCVLCFRTVLCVVSLHAHSPFVSIFIQVYEPLPPGGNPLAVNKYHIIKERGLSR
jgi:hypothetical protein